MPNDSILFFPGIVFHELSHVIACLVTGVKIGKVKWFGTDEAFVEHAKPNVVQGLIISIAPLILGNAIGFELLLFGHDLANHLSVFAIVVYWFAVSLMLYSFPSKQDAQNSFETFTEFYKKRILGKNGLLSKLFWLLTFPFFFVPLVILFGIILLFDSVFSLRALWIAALFLLSLYPGGFF